MKITDTTIENSRVVNAPRELVWKAWTEPEHLARWYGPKGFTNTFHQFDLRQGGRWKFTMHGPDRGNYENEIEFKEIVPPKRLVLTRISKPLFQVTVTFEPIAEKTKVTFFAEFPSKEEFNKVRSFVPEKNEENLDRLEAELARMAVSVRQ